MRTLYNWKERKKRKEAHIKSSKIKINHFSEIIMVTHSTCYRFTFPNETFSRKAFSVVTP